MSPEVGPLEPADDRTLVIDDAGTLSLHLPCAVLGVVVGPRHPHPRSADCGWLCDEEAQHIVRCDDVAGHVGEHRARYHSGAGWPVGYFAADDTLEAPAPGDAGASTTTTGTEPATDTVAAPADVRPPSSPLVTVLGLVFGTASGLLMATGYGMWTGVL